MTETADPTGCQRPPALFGRTGPSGSDSCPRADFSRQSDQLHRELSGQFEVACTMQRGWSLAKNLETAPGGNKGSVLIATHCPGLRTRGLGLGLISNYRATQAANRETLLYSIEAARAGTLSTERNRGRMILLFRIASRPLPMLAASSYSLGSPVSRLFLSSSRYRACVVERNREACVRERERRRRELSIDKKLWR